MRLIHKSCGQVTEAVLTCSQCGEVLRPRDVRAAPGPGDLDDLVETALASSPTAAGSGIRRTGKP